jgi:hypothetical protein
MFARRLPWFFAFGLASTHAFAQQQGPATQSAPSLPEVESDEPPPPLVPAAKDTLAGHVTAGLSVGAQWPFGELRQGENSSNLGAGFGGNLDLGIGVSRTVVIGVWGSFYDYGTNAYGSNETSYTVGPTVSYHLVQGFRFDPWILAGVGYRELSRDTRLVNRHFSGIEFAHVVVGGDYYLWSGLALGTWIDFDSGVFTTRPGSNEAGQTGLGNTSGSAVHYGFSGGLRLVLDFPGK